MMYAETFKWEFNERPYVDASADLQSPLSIFPFVQH